MAKQRSEKTSTNQAQAEAAPPAGRFAYDGLERAIHEKARLGIMTSLITQGKPLSFGELKELCDLTDGNLNRHLEVLSEEGLVVVTKDQADGRARTMCKITPTGRKRFLGYLEELSRVLADAEQAAQVASKAGLSPA